MDVPRLMTPVAAQATWISPSDWREPTDDEIVAWLRERVESGTIKGMEINLCSVHGSVFTGGVFHEGIRVCQYAWYSGHAVEACFGYRGVVIPVSDGGGGPTMMHWDRDAAEEREEQDQGHDWQVLSVWEAKRQQPSGTLSALIGCGGCGQAFVSTMMEPCPWPVDDREDRP